MMSFAVAPTLDELRLKAQAAIGAQDKNHFVQRIVDSLQNPKAPGTNEPLVGSARNSFLGQQLIALGVCFDHGHFCNIDKDFASVLYREGRKRAVGRDRYRLEQIAEPSLDRVVPLVRRRNVVSEPG